MLFRRVVEIVCAISDVEGSAHGAVVRDIKRLDALDARHHKLIKRG